MFYFDCQCGVELYVIHVKYPWFRCRSNIWIRVTFMSSFSCLINENITKVCSFLYVGVYLDKILACQKSCQKWWRTPSSAWFWKAKQKHFELQPDLFWLLQICNSCNWYQVSQYFSRANLCHHPSIVELHDFKNIYDLNWVTQEQISLAPRTFYCLRAGNK